MMFGLRGLPLKFKSFLVLAATSVALSACTLPNPSKNGNDAGATFAVNSQDASFTTVTNDPVFALPNSRTLSEKACIVDIQYSRPVMNHHFIISGTTGADQDVVTDASGCLVWKENVPYNHLASAAFVEARRTLTAKGYQQGSRTISFAINPWEGKALSMKDSEVLDLQTGDAAKLALQGLDPATKKVLPHPLWLINASVTVLPKQLSNSGTAFSFEFQAAPAILTKDINNQDKAIPLYQGKFTAKLSLIRVKNSGTTETREIFAQSDTLTIDSLFNQQIDMTNLFKIPGGCSMQQWDMGVEISAVGAPAGVQDFHGVYSLGNCEAVQGHQSLSLLNSQEFKNNGQSTFKITDFAKNVSGSLLQTSSASSNNSRSAAPSNTAQDTNSLSSSVSVGQVTATLIGITANSQAMKQRMFNLNFCLRNSLDGSPVRTSSAKITGLNGQTVSATSFDNGCFQVQDSMSYNYFTAECWMPKQIRIQSADLGLDAKIAVEVNPVVEGGTFLYDVRFPENQRQYPCAQGDTKIFASSYSFDKVRYSYEVSETLGLQVNKTGIFRVNLGLERPSLFTGAGTTIMPLPGGKYLLRWAIVDVTLKDYSQSYGKVYGAGEQFVNIEGGVSMINEEITISASNLKSIGINSYMLFEVVPTDPDPNATVGLHNFTFKAPILISNNSGGAAIEYVKEKLGFAEPVVQHLTQQFKKDMAENQFLDKKFSSKEFFAQDNGLTLINLNKDASPFANIKTQQLKDWITRGGTIADLKKIGSDPLLESVCQHWVSKVLSQPHKSGKQTAIDQYIKSFDNRRRSDNIYGLETPSPRDETLALMNYDCEASEEQHPGSYFSIQYHYMIDKPTLQAYKGGKILDFDISQHVTLSSNYSFTTSQSLSAGGGVKAGGGGDGAYSALSAGVDVGYSFSYSWSNSTSVGDSVSIGTGIGAKMEMNTLNIRAADYEKCAVITLNSNQIIDVGDKLQKRSSIASFFYHTFGQGTLQMLMNSSSDEEKMELVNRGYMICMGEKAGKNLVFDENYYIINQSVSTANNIQTIDAGDALNRPFFFALRGDADFMGALEFIQRSAPMPQAYEDQYQSSYLSKDPYKLMFSRTLRNYPGHFVSPF